VWKAKGRYIYLFVLATDKLAEIKAWLLMLIFIDRSLNTI